MMKKISLVLGIIALTLIAHSVFAANPQITNVSTAIASGNFTASYQFDGNFAQDVKFFGWFGDFSKPTTQWDTHNLLATLGKTQATPIQFQYSVPLTGLSPNLVYGYAIANQSTDTAHPATYFYAPNGTSIFRCFTTTNPSVACPTSTPGSGGAGGNTSNGQTAAFNYVGNPSVSCDTNIELCEFKIVIQTTSAGSLSFKLHGFPKTLYDGGTMQYSDIVADPETPTVAANQQYQVAFSVPFAQIESFANAHSDGKFYFNFFESNNVKPSPLSNAFDVTANGMVYTQNPNTGTLVTTGVNTSAGDLVLTGSQTAGLPDIVIHQPTMSDVGTITIAGTINAPAAPVNTNLALFFGGDANSLDNIGSLFSGNLTTAKTFSKSIPGHADGTYWFEIRDIATGSLGYSYGVNSFTVSGTGSSNGTASFGGTGAGVGTPSGTAIDGYCGTAKDTTAPTINMITGTPCGNGTSMTAAGITDGGATWNWTCDGLNGGTPASCTANKGTDVNGGPNKLKNPLAAGLDTIPKIFKAFYNGLVVPIAVMIIAMFIMYSGFLFVTARKSGSTDGIANAKRVFKWTIVGSLMLLGGLVIANALQGTLCEIVNNCPAVQPLQ